MAVQVTIDGSNHTDATAVLSFSGANTSGARDIAPGKSFGPISLIGLRDRTSVSIILKAEDAKNGAMALNVVNYSNGPIKDVQNKPAITIAAGSDESFTCLAPRDKMLIAVQLLAEVG